MKKRRVILGICWLLSLAAISFYGGAVSYGIFFGITLIPVISFVYILCVWFCHKIYQEIGSRSIVCGQAVPYYFVLQNESRFAFSGIKVHFYSDFSYVEEMPEEIEYELLPGDKYRYETSFVCKYRGEYEVGIKETVITDFWGLFGVRCAVREGKKVVADPKLIRIEELKSVSDISAMLQREHVRTPTQLDVVTREYAAGDALKQIHWKNTARENQLMSRKQAGEEKRGVALFFDTKRCSGKPAVYLPVENKMLEAVLALSLFLCERNIPVSVLYHQNGVRQTCLNDAGDLDTFYRQLREVHFDESGDLHISLQSALQSGVLMDRAFVFFVLHKIDYDVINMTHRLAGEGTVTVFYVVTDENAEAFCRMSDLSRRIIVIGPEEELEGAL